MAWQRKPMWFVVGIRGLREPSGPGRLCREVLAFPSGITAVLRNMFKGMGPVPEPTVIRRDSGEAALTRLRDLVPEAFRGPWGVEIAVGRPADTIVRLARERNADLIVMATHGRTGLEHVVMGSVAEKVVRLAPCPVLTVKGG